MSNESLLVPLFKVHTVLNEAKSKKAGRPIYDDLEVIEIRFAGDKQKVAVFPAHEAEPNATRESIANGGEVITYAMAYKEQYKRFKSQEVQVADGTPLSELTFLTQAKRYELKALNVHTAEALAALDGMPLKQLGMGGRELKNQAQAYLAKASGSADVTRVAAENEGLRQQVADLQAQMAALASGQQPSAGSDEEGDEREGEGDGGNEGKALEDCTDAELKAFIKRETGESVKGNPSRETLLNRALEIATAPEKAA